MSSRAAYDHFVDDRDQAYLLPAAGEHEDHTVLRERPSLSLGV